MISAALRYSKSLWSYNPLPTGCVLYLPLWHPNFGGSVFKSVDLFESSCTVSGSAPTHSFKGWDLPGTDELIDIGNIGTNIKSLSFWMNPASTTQSILEEVDNTGPSIGTGTMSYASWDDCFVDGVNTDTVTAAWHNIILTSTSNVDMSAFRFGLVNAAHFDGEVGEVAAWTDERDLAAALYYYNKTRERYL